MICIVSGRRIIIKTVPTMRVGQVKMEALAAARFTVAPDQPGWEVRRSDGEPLVISNTLGVSGLADDDTIYIDPTPGEGA